MIEGQYRQGDVLLSRVGTPGSNFQKLPDTLTELPTENGVVVLAKGDSTGNPHFFESDALLHAAPDGQRFVSLASAQPLRCPSHTWLTVEPGVYELTIQREWTNAEESRQVED